MFLIENNTFYVTRGDAGSFDISFQDYTFQQGDVLKFNIYEEDGMDTNPVESITVTVVDATETVTVNVSADKTRLDSPITEPKEYWYEITLNDTQTPFCYDYKTGPKKFILLPGGID